MSIINEQGIQIDDLQDIIDQYIAGYKRIYGQDINVEANSPDGQIIYFNAQVDRDNLEFMVDVFNSMNPDTAFGRILDMRVAWNGIRRREQTFTATNITLVVSRIVSLQGLDGATDGTGLTFTVADDTGNLFYLDESITLEAGTYSLLFRAAQGGLIEALPNTIQTIITTLNGVDSVNNPDVPLRIGVPEETDPELRARRRASVSMFAQGYVQSLEARLRNLVDVLDARVWENPEDVTNADGIPPHSIWTVVDGGTDFEIANAMSESRSMGCNMLGDQSYDYYYPDGDFKTFKWDFAESLPLYIKMELTSAIEGYTIDEEGIRNYLVEQSSFRINAPADASYFTTLVKQFDPNVVISSSEVGKYVLPTDPSPTFSSFVFPNVKKERFLLLTTNIDLHSIT